MLTERSAGTYGRGTCRSIGTNRGRDEAPPQGISNRASSPNCSKRVALRHYAPVSPRRVDAPMKNLLSAFKTLPWEQRDPERRAAAVRDERAPELLARLPEIAVQDPEPAVRRAALARLSAASLLLERHRADPDTETRALAMTRLSRVLLDPAAGLAPGARLAALSLDLPNELLERVAESAPEVEARRAAVARVARPAFLLRRCGEETDAALREILLGRIDGEETLDRLAETLRKRDKNLARQARERAEALRLARGDAAALQRYALGLCETLTEWAQQLPEHVETRLVAATQEWQGRRDALDAATQRRVDAYLERLQDALAMRARRAAGAMVVDPVTDAADASVPPPDAGPEAVAQVLMQGEAGYATADQETVAMIPAAPAPRAATDWSELDRRLAVANRAVVAQRLGAARPALEQVQVLLKQLPTPDRARRDHLAQIEAKVAELDQWQRWSGNRVRARLCDDLEALIAAGHHPDAVANRVRELQQEWARVEAAEPGDADRSSGLARRFRGLCGRAMAPTKPYFEQRHALREQRREALDALLMQATPEALAPLSTPAAIGLRRKLVDALRLLDDLEPKARTPLARRLREGLSRIDAWLDAQREDAALGRRKLIARLRRELTHADPISALDLARQAQTEWRTLPRAAKDQEVALEKELGALIDPLFAREREQREQSVQQAGRVESESRRILDELAGLAQGDGEMLSHAEGRIAALAANWKELHAVIEPARPPREREPMRANGPGSHGQDRGRDARSGARDARGSRDRDPRNKEARAPRASDSERAFDQAVTRVRQAQLALEAGRRGLRLQALVEAAQLFAAVEHDGIANEAAQARWDAMALDEVDRRQLASRWAQAQDARGLTPRDDTALAAAQAWLIEAELDAGLDSPAEVQALRRQRQLHRLASRMQGATAAAADPRERLLHWAQLGPVPAAESPDLQARLARVLAFWSRPPA